jgi:hypothetical protein
MNLRNVFKAISSELFAKFKKSAEIQHNVGKGDNREDALMDFLKENLPKRYALGSGEVISSDNSISKQCDIVIYDADHCPILVTSKTHSVYPIESVYGVIEIKSVLTSSELEKSYANIQSVKNLVKDEYFAHSTSPGSTIGIKKPMIFAAVFAYSVDRSLDAVSKQADLLDKGLTRIEFRPELISILEHGIIGPRNSYRDIFNNFKVPDSFENEKLTIHNTKRHTLLRFYLQMLQELNSIILQPLDLKDYLDLPEIIDGHRVRKHEKFLRNLGEENSKKIFKLSQAGIRKIFEYCSKTGAITYRQHMLNAMGPTNIIGMTDERLNELVFDFNPNKLPPLNFSKLFKDENGKVSYPDKAFQPWPIYIDDKAYFVDFSALNENDFEENKEMEPEDFYSD